MFKLAETDTESKRIETIFVLITPLGAYALSLRFSLQLSVPKLDITSKQFCVTLTLCTLNNQRTRRDKIQP